MLLCLVTRDRELGMGTRGNYIYVLSIDYAVDKLQCPKNVNVKLNIIEE